MGFRPQEAYRVERATASSEGTSNGADYTEWESSGHLIRMISAKYQPLARSVRDKAACRHALLKLASLPIATTPDDAPVVGMVTRMTPKRVSAFSARRSTR